jgi:hypothetical protein
VHVPSEFLPIAALGWFWSDGIVGDLQHSVVLDNSKIRRYMPSFAPRITWSTGVRRLLAWRAEHAAQTRARGVKRLMDMRFRDFAASVPGQHWRRRAPVAPPPRRSG